MTDATPLRNLFGLSARTGDHRSRPFFCEGIAKSGYTGKNRLLTKNQPMKTAHETAFFDVL